MRKEYLVIDATVSDNADYEWVTEEGINNTLKTYWDWAQKNCVSLQFEIRYPQTHTWGNTINVYALFKNDVDYRDFIAQHVWNLPKTRLRAEKLGEACFVE